VIQVGGGNLSPMYGDTKRVGRFTLEERRQLLQRFQQKRTQRNFNKKIKYACRKSLADKRPRVRGRFARNDDSTEHPSHMNGHKIEDDDEVGRVMQLIFFYSILNFLTTTSDMSPIKLVSLQWSKRF
jgi:hypothetical protein